MPKERKSPQQKKQLGYQKDHFTFSESPHAFPRQWRRKKTQANRKYRRKSDELLAQAKPEISAEDAELIIGDITESHLKKSVSRERLRKSSTVTIGEKIRIKLEKRKETVGRRVNNHRRYDSIIKEAVSALTSLEGQQLVDCVKRLAHLLGGGDPIEWLRLQKSEDPIDRALYLIERLTQGDANYADALRRNQELCKSFQAW